MEENSQLSFDWYASTPGSSTMRFGGFAHARNGIRIAPLLSTVSRMKPLYALATHVKRHLAS
jgi:hypothetical protein